MFDEGILVSSSDDNRLQYYGGFEYVEKQYRQEVGDYVFYSANDDRVYDHVTNLMKEVENG